MSESFTERLHKAAREANLITDPVAPVDADLIPELETTYQPTDADVEIDALIDGIDIIDAYARWCGKMQPHVGGKRESIMISCPIPGHTDRNPSAFINLDKQAWFCAACDQGGDKFDIAAYHFGSPVPGYKDGKNFPELRRRIAESEGYVVRTTPGGQTYVQHIEMEMESPDSLKQPAAKSERSILKVPANDDKVDNLQPTDGGVEVDDAESISRLRSSFAVLRAHDPETEMDLQVNPVNPVAPAISLAASAVPLPAEPDEPVVKRAKLASVHVLNEDETAIEYPTIEWESIVSPGGFLDRWMRITSKDDLPDEYYFWLGLQALGFAVGRDTVLIDNPPVKANLYVCLFGHSGVGKSRATQALVRLLTQALPYDHDDPTSTGAYMVPSPGSAEALVDAFSKPIYDPANPKVISHHAPVRGLIRIDELSSLAARGARAGSAMKPTMMEFYDGYNRVELRSRGAGHVIAADPFASAITTTQPLSIRTLLAQEDADSGFVNRWVFACGREKRRVAMGRATLDIEPCVDLLRKVRGWASPIREITLNDAAFAYWDSFFHGTFEPARAGTDDVLLTRCDLHLKKIMLLLALDRHSEIIDLSIVADAIKIWEYLKRSYRILGGEIGMGVMEGPRQRIIGIMVRYQKKNKRGITRKELLHRLQRDRISIEILAGVLRLMLSVGEVEERIIQGTSGPPTNRYTYTLDDDD